MGKIYKVVYLIKYIPNYTENGKSYIQETWKYIDVYENEKLIEENSVYIDNKYHDDIIYNVASYYEEDVYNKSNKTI